MKKGISVGSDVLQGQEGTKRERSMLWLAPSLLSLPAVMRVAFVIPFISCFHCAIPSLFWSLF